MTVNLHPDYELVKSLQKGDRRAFDKLFNKYAGKIFYLAKSHFGSREDAEGLVQDVFIKVWENRKNIKEYLSFRSYLFTITYNSIRKFLRIKYRSIELPEDFMQDIARMQDESFLQLEYIDLLDQMNLALEKLTPRQKEIFLLSREKGLSYKEIAEELSVTPKTVENHIHEALKTIRKHLKKVGLIGMVFMALFL